MLAKFATSVRFEPSPRHSAHDKATFTADDDAKKNYVEMYLLLGFEWYLSCEKQKCVLASRGQGWQKTDIRYIGDIVSYRNVDRYRYEKKMISVDPISRKLEASREATF
jgi:hypothetical protein